MRLTALMKQVADAIAPGAPVETGGGAAAIARDEILLDRLLAGPMPQARIRLWVNDQCLVSTRSLSRHPKFQNACAMSEAKGWPVYIRKSGGTTVAHRSGILNVSLLTSAPCEGAPHSHPLASLTDRLSRAMEMLGLSVTTGLSPGSYCDGSHNILINGAKFVGTASFMRKSVATVAQLAHAAISVEGDVASDIAAIASFEAGLGFVPEYVASAHSTVQLALGGSARPIAANI